MKIMLAELNKVCNWDISMLNISLSISHIVLSLLRACYACSRYASCYSLLLVLEPSVLGKGENYL